MPRPIANPPNPWESTHREWIGPPPPSALEVYEERARSILSENHSPDVPFRWSVNPYRGCFHGCAYCYARPTHQYLGWGAGTDFERRIVVKVNAPEILAREFARGKGRGETIAFSGNTDCYQPLEASYRLTRGCLEVCREHRRRVGLITKGTLVRRDLDLLARLAESAGATVYISIPFLDRETSLQIEPYASPPEERFRTLTLLTEAGVPCGVSVSPVIPGLSDDQLPAILERAREAGARHAAMILLRLPAEVGPVFRERLEQAFPGRARRVMHALAETRQGQDRQHGFGDRMRGSGPRWEMIRRLFETTCQRLGYETRSRPAPPPAEVQGELFPL